MNNTLPYISILILVFAVLMASELFKLKRDVRNIKRKLNLKKTRK